MATIRAAIQALQLMNKCPRLLMTAVFDSPPDAKGAGHLLVVHPGLLAASFRTPARWRLGVVGGFNLLCANLIKELLKAHNNVVGHALATPPGQDCGNGRLVDTGTTLDFFLRQTACNEFGEDGLCAHEVHHIANVLIAQVPKQSHTLLRLQYG